MELSFSFSQIKIIFPPTFPFSFLPSSAILKRLYIQQGGNAITEITWVIILMLQQTKTEKKSKDLLL